MEPAPQLEVADQLATVLHPAEFEEMESALPEDRSAVFARLWARKERTSRAWGIGRGREASADGIRGDLPGWCLTDLSVDSGYAAVLAVSSPTLSTVRLHRALPA